MTENDAITAATSGTSQNTGFRANSKLPRSLTGG
jgi:hypothetical protein